VALLVQLDQVAQLALQDLLALPEQLELLVQLAQLAPLALQDLLALPARLD
jgi:hypothetical protein